MENEKLPLKYDWYLLGNAEVALNYLNHGNKEGIEHAKKSLELILKDTESGDGWIKKVLTDPEVLPKTIGSMLETYQQYRENQIIGDLMQRHTGNLEKYLGENAKVAYEELEKFAGERYEDILKKIGETNHTIEGKKKYKKGSDEEVKTAEKTKEKYQKVILTLNLLEKNYRSNFQKRVEEEMIKDSLKEMYNPKGEK